MFITKKFLSRRTWLRGMGCAIALPFLDSMVPAATPEGRLPARPARRFGAVFVPHGKRPGYWTPEKVGKGFDFTTILKPIEPFREALTVISELCDPLDGHAATVAAWLSGSTPARTLAENVHLGATIDQVIARKIGLETLLPSIELAIEDFTGYVNGCDPFFACAYMNTLSWRTATEPLPMEINPRVVFERIFGVPGDPKERVKRIQTEKSILDSVKQDLFNIQSTLPTRDRGRIQDYLDSIREVERRIEVAEKSTAALAPVSAPIGIPESYEEHVALQFELLTLAYQADIARVFTFMMARELSQRVYPNLGISEPHHSMSHHGNDPEKIANLIRLNTYHVMLFGKFLKRLKETPDGDGSLLDHSLILYGSGMSESDTHSRLNVPTLLAGGAGGRLNGNRHIKTANKTPLANLMVSIANIFGVETDKFGSSTGRVDV